MTMEMIELYEELNMKGHLSDKGKDHYIGMLKRENMDSLPERTHESLSKEGFVKKDRSEKNDK